MKREAKFQTIFGQYIREKRLNGYFELKHTSKESLPFSDVESYQLAGLLAAEKEGFFWKISDADPRVKPFDCLYAKPMPAYVVIKFPKFFVLIWAVHFLLERNRSTRESLTEERARQIAQFVVKLK